MSRVITRLIVISSTLRVSNLIQLVKNGSVIGFQESS
jgi:hypothetical protein